MLRNTRVVGDEVEESLNVAHVVFPDLLPPRVIGLRVLPAATDVVGREGVVVVDVGRAAGHPPDAADLLEGQVVALGLQVAPQQLVTARVITGGLREGNLIVPAVGETEAKIVGLQLPIARTRFSRVAAGDERQELAVGTTGRDRFAELMVRSAGTSAGEGLAVFALPLPTDSVGDAGAWQQVALSGGVDEDGGGMDLTALHFDRPDAPPLAVKALDTLLQPHRDAGLFEPFVEDLVGDVGLEVPLDVLAVSFADMLEKLA